MVAKKAKKATRAGKKIKGLSVQHAKNVKGGGVWDKFGDIKGESTDKDHKDWNGVLKYDHDVKP